MTSIKLMVLVCHHLQKIKDIPAHTVGATIKVPVTISWDLESGHDKVETDALMAQYVGTDYTLTISAGAILTQLD